MFIHAIIKPTSWTTTIAWFIRNYLCGRDSILHLKPSYDQLQVYENW
jgi:hypothetical protein